MVLKIIEKQFGIIIMPSNAISVLLQVPIKQLIYNSFQYKIIPTSYIFPLSITNNNVIII